MGVIAINRAKAGMLLAEDVLSFSGQLLAAKGVKLTDSTIQQLIHQGIGSISVVSEGEEEETFTEDEIQKAEEMFAEQVLARFYKKPSDPMMKVLFESALRIEAIYHLRCQDTE